MTQIVESPPDVNSKRPEDNLSTLEESIRIVTQKNEKEPKVIFPAESTNRILMDQIKTPEAREKSEQVQSSRLPNRPKKGYRVFIQQSISLKN